MFSAIQYNYNDERKRTSKMDGEVILIISDIATDGTPVTKLSRCSEKYVLVKCEDCLVEREQKWSNYLKAQKLRAPLTLCRSCSVKRMHKRHKAEGRQVVPWNKGKKYPQFSGPNAHNWSGGQYESGDGYVMVYVPRQAIRKQGDIGWLRYRRRHQLVMEKMLGRSLVKGEVVHHINGDKHDDRPENLYLCSRSVHKTMHNILERVAFKLVRTGAISFDTGEYQVAHLKPRELLEQPVEANQQPSHLGIDGRFND